MGLRKRGGKGVCVAGGEGSAEVNMLNTSSENCDSDPTSRIKIFSLHFQSTPPRVLCKLAMCKPFGVIVIALNVSMP